MARTIVGALFTYIVAPIIVGLFTKGVDETSLGGRLLNAIYPPQVSEHLTQAPSTPAPQPTAPIPTPAPTSPIGNTAAPVVSGPIATPATPLTRSPKDALVTAAVAGPLTVSGADFRLALQLTSASDDLPIFATGGYNLEGWSATVQPGNVSCSIDITGLTGLTSSQVDRWRQDEGRMTRLPANAPASMSAGFHCQRDLATARSASFTLTFGYVAGDQTRIVRFYGNDVALPALGSR